MCADRGSQRDAVLKEADVLLDSINRGTRNWKGESFVR